MNPVTSNAVYGIISSEVSALTVEQDWKAVFGNEGTLTPNLNVANSSIFNSSDITIVDP
jgi:hypothetical protein